MHELLAVDGQGERLADALVVERRPADVAAVKIDSEPGLDVQLFRMLAAVDVDLVLGQLIGGIELAGSKHPLFGRKILDGIKFYFIKFHVGGVPVAGIAGDHDLLLGPPLLEQETGPLPTRLPARVQRLPFCSNGPKRAMTFTGTAVPARSGRR